MIKSIKFPFKESFILHSILNYLDKAVSLISPIIILKFLHDNLLYNKIEYILSSSVILSVFLDSGLSSYYFYGYRISADKQAYLEDIERNFSVLFSAEALISILILIAGFVFSSYSIIVFACLLVRANFLSYINFKFNSYRVQNAPSKIFVITISVNLLSLFIFLLLYHFNKGNEFFYFVGYFLFQFVFILTYNIAEFKFFELKKLIKIARIGVLFAWPLILNVFVISIVVNYGKVYTFKHLSADNMTTISVLQRFMVVIQLAHTASNAFYLKRIFDVEVPRLEFSVLKKYTLMMLGSVVLVIAAIIINNVLHIIKPITFDATFFLLIVFYIFYCYGGFLSTYFTLFNENMIRLMGSVLVVIVYFGLLWLTKPASLLGIVMIMAIAGLINLAYTFFYLINKQVIKFQ